MCCNAQLYIIRCNSLYDEVLESFQAICSGVIDFCTANSLPYVREHGQTHSMRMSVHRLNMVCAALCMLQHICTQGKHHVRICLIRTHKRRSMMNTVKHTRCACLCMVKHTFAHVCTRFAQRCIPMHTTCFRCSDHAPRPFGDSVIAPPSFLQPN